MQPRTGSLNSDEIRRYARHILLPEVGMRGQETLKNARVAIVGAGGLGSPLSMYLAAAGVGRLGLIDADTVDVSNLHRQILFDASSLGQSKVECAKARLQQVNPHCQVDVHAARLDASNAMELLRHYDVVADGTDNFQARYLINDACVLLKKPNVNASISRFFGQLSVFDAERGPCYRCLYPEPPPPGLVPSCAEGGVLGVLPGVLGVMQATEVIKLILGIGEPLIGRVVLYDALAASFRELRLSKDKDCVVCGEHSTVTTLTDLPVYCGASQDSRGSEETIDTTSLTLRLTGPEARACLVCQEHVEKTFD